MRISRRTLLLALLVALSPSTGLAQSTPAALFCTYAGTNYPATIQAVAGVPTVGTPGNDVIRGTNGPDVIDSGGGNDIICGRGGADRITGRDGNEAITGDSGNDIIT
ncbi:MAG: calcium-binding protein, partial [Chloroflexota bacterium]|nr:calcium-binding protein [Chloroflexota bacterium]